MKVILYMAITANGLITSENDDTGWVTETEWKSFSGMIKKAGNMIIGRRTYEIMMRNNEFNKSKLNKIRTIVVTNNVSFKTHNPKFISIAKSPKESLNILKKEGFKNIMICGGGNLNSSFMRENLINELYFDVEPILIGKGIKLFSDSNFTTKLKLLNIRKISKNEVQIHYKVK